MRSILDLTWLFSVNYSAKRYHSTENFSNLTDNAKDLADKVLEYPILMTHSMITEDWQD